MVTSRKWERKLIKVLLERILSKFQFDEPARSVDIFPEGFGLYDCIC